MQQADVIVVGGGPAGSSCAWQLQRRGLSVLVVDRAPFPRDKPCAGWITPQVIESLQLDVEAYRRGHTFQPIHGFRCGVIGGKSVDVDYGREISFGIRRCEFDRHLLERSGARGQLGEPVEQLDRDGGQWTINGRYTAPMLVGAGGHRCPVARRLGAREPSGAPVVVAREIEILVDDDACPRIDPAMPQLYFCDDLLGYGWCLRKGRHVNVGLGRTDPQGLPAHVDEFVDFLRQRGMIDCQLPDRWMGHAYQLYERARPRLFDDGAVLVGDAAGLAYATSGEGIRPAVESGLVAADVIAAAAGDYCEDSLAVYQDALSRRLGQPSQPGVAERLPASWLKYLGARLLTTRWFCRQILLDKWFLHRHQEALVAGAP